MKNNQPKILFPPIKKLGQNFLFDKNYLQKIVEICPIDNNTIIVEIGSGYGDLTNLLAGTNCQQVISCEKDKNLFQWLEKSNANQKKITFLHQDALLINWLDFCSPYKNNSLIVVGNLPYYITNSLIINLLLNYQLFKSFVFLVQKEVAQRWTANQREYSALSVFINYLANTSLVFAVPPQVFVPPPSVEGALTLVEIKRNVSISQQQLLLFWRFLKNCFRFRRKTLLNNLVGFAGNWKKEWEEYFLANNYSPKIRPHNLTPDDYFQLFLYWQNLN